ncbi:hypothetical protein HDU76_005695, partial [Blyttiomyces sp. JEL0837]
MDDARITPQLASAEVVETIDERRILREFYQQHEMNTILWLPVDRGLYLKVQSYVNILDFKTKKRMALIAMTFMIIRTIFNILIILTDSPETFIWDIITTIIFFVASLLSFGTYALLATMQLKHPVFAIERLHFVVAIAAFILTSFGIDGNSLVYQKYEVDYLKTFVSIYDPMDFIVYGATWMFATSNIITGTVSGFSTMTLYFIGVIFIFGPVKSAGMLIIYYGSIFLIEYRERNRYDLMLKTYLLEQALLSQFNFGRHLWQKSEFQFHRIDIERVFHKEPPVGKIDDKYLVTSTRTFRTADSECIEVDAYNQANITKVEHKVSGQQASQDDLSVEQDSPESQTMSFRRMFCHDYMGMFSKCGRRNQQVSPVPSDLADLALPRYRTTYNQRTTNRRSTVADIKGQFKVTQSLMYKYWMRFVTAMGWKYDFKVSDLAFHANRMETIMYSIRVYLTSFAFLGILSPFLDIFSYCQAETYVPKAICESDPTVHTIFILRLSFLFGMPLFFILITFIPGFNELCIANNGK